MARRHPATSRVLAARIGRWSVLILVGVAGGMMLGERIVGDGPRNASIESESFSRLSANPDALGPQGEAAPFCPNCRLAYDGGTRSRDDRDEFTDGEPPRFRADDFDTPAGEMIEFRIGDDDPLPQPPPVAPVERIDEAPTTAQQGNPPPAGEAAPMETPSMPATGA
ncbi:MAG: hypothetical protein KYX64_06520 [Sphingopyxis sp.]|nr:hypothetical protein [Sphingopyxis sp.]